MSNLLLRKNQYSALVMIPKELQLLFGKSRFSKALNTGDERKAQQLAAPYVTLWKAQIEQARGNKGAMAQATLYWQSAFNLQEKSITAALTSSEREYSLNGMEALTDHFNEHLKAIPEPEAVILHGLVNGTSTLITEHYEAWKSKLDLAPKTKDQMTRDIDTLFKRFSTLEEITKEKVLKLISDIEDQGKGVSTIKRLLFAYRNYWYYLQDKRIVSIEHDPFDVQKALQGKFKRAKKNPARKAFTTDEVIKMWTIAKEKKDYKLADLIVLGAYTGARIEELCSLKLTDVTDDSFRLGEAKTEAGVRVVPLHSALSKLINRLKAESKDSYLINQLTFNKYGDRSNAIGKRFGRLKTEAGCDSTLVFHSFRKTLITLLEQAEVPENFCCDIVGHEKGTMGYGHYSDGASLANKKEAIEKINYPFPKDSLR